MDFLENLEYRDPLFGIVVFIFCIGIISLFAYYWNYLISKKRQDSLNKFIGSFDYIGFDKEVQEFLALSPNPASSLLFMAKMYQKSANYEKAIRLYVTLLDSIKNPVDKVPILESLGIVYEKAGFPLRAKEIYLEILHYFPRNPLVLKALIRTYEKLSLFKDALNALDCLEEMQGSTGLYRCYLKTKILISSQQKGEETTKKLLVFLQKEPLLARLILNYFKDFYPTLFWECLGVIPKEILLELQDILWNLNNEAIPENLAKELQNMQTNPQSKILKDIFEAKGILPLSFSQKVTFELETICLLRTHKSFQGDLGFNYQCESCKATTPLSAEHCPHCEELLTLKTRVFLKEKQDEARYSFL
ncbi:tetratricopeptide repeat protein [uncultured Helicobacter sp.]|uniref:tetratricopeptide repeat protein n=1 Tax=uncultured Helicobacter sp. TaxID=175537 RepID=UPI00262A8C56|nr:tetratricopeptide repeat protein [uncultured Helicobacter sp.]